ncbi:hypothetical protein KY310_01245 [Candidatus Woesearchaeota archaeon]|nr:hypothetical protein [Candidatus Woesearchaeota archaeon]
MGARETIAKIRDELLAIADIIRGPIAIKAVTPPSFNKAGLTIPKQIKKDESAQAVATLLRTAAAEVDSLNLDEAERQLVTAQKEWAKIIQKQGRSKELSDLLQIIINLKQKIKDAKADI